ncbi:hypothetical protein OESDEN_01867 [Oesophagostomum dentatum]|uniref:Uncharacterized protein n=1 Tax=Oesophagostomum dentatum TaxID=61180 RepID=A0A0B1TQ02_OESDE|nr:hypothetical protein OESDEN_01867 [Oesophagostomum dentatum]
MFSGLVSKSPCQIPQAGTEQPPSVSASDFDGRTALSDDAKSGADGRHESAHDESCRTGCSGILADDAKCDAGSGGGATTSVAGGHSGGLGRGSRCRSSYAYHSAGSRPTVSVTTDAARRAQHGHGDNAADTAAHVSTAHVATKRDVQAARARHNRVRGRCDNSRSDGGGVSRDTQQQRVASDLIASGRGSDVLVAGDVVIVDKLLRPLNPDQLAHKERVTPLSC